MTFVDVNRLCRHQIRWVVQLRENHRTSVSEKPWTFSATKDTSTPQSTRITFGRPVEQEVFSLFLRTSPRPAPRARRERECSQNLLPVSSPEVLGVHLCLPRKFLAFTYVVMLCCSGRDLRWLQQVFNAPSAKFEIVWEGRDSLPRSLPSLPGATDQCDVVSLCQTFNPPPLWNLEVENALQEKIAPNNAVRSVAWIRSFEFMIEQFVSFFRGYWVSIGVWNKTYRVTH